MNTLFGIAFALLTVLSSSIGPAFAAEIHGIKLPDQVKLEGKNLELNGMGLRQATIFNVNVYAGALYVEKKASNPDEILASDSPKSLVMVFMRDVDAKDVSKAWNEGFEKNCETGCEALKPSLEKLKSAMTTDMKKGDVMTINFLSNKVELILANAKAGTVEGKDFSKTLLRVWLGKNPPNAGLKKGLLGVKD